MTTIATMVKDREVRDTRPDRVRASTDTKRGNPQPVCSNDDLHGHTDRYRSVRPLFSLDELKG